jgi:hypothetical protein
LVPKGGGSVDLRIQYAVDFCFGKSLVCENVDEFGPSVTTSRILDDSDDTGTKRADLTPNASPRAAINTLHVQKGVRAERLRWLYSKAPARFDTTLLRAKLVSKATLLNRWNSVDNFR